MAKKHTPGTTPTTASNDAAPSGRRRTTRRAATATTPASNGGSAASDLAPVSTGLESTRAISEALAPTYHEIAVAAYLRYLERGGQDGRDFDDWIEAETALRRRLR